MRQYTTVQLRELSVCEEIVDLKYSGNSENSDEWFALVREKFPNVDVVDCENSDFISIKTDLPIHLMCKNSRKLKTLILPQAKSVTCYNCSISTLIAPNATWVECDNNPLEHIELPVLDVAFCDAAHKITARKKIICRPYN